MQYLTVQHYRSLYIKNKRLKRGFMIKAQFMSFL